MEYLNEYKKWCTSDVFDEETKKELINIKNDNKEIEDRFYKELEFGTAGLRGIIGAGTNRMNIYTVGKATQGLANYIKKQHGEDRGVAISYDSRHMSPEFSKEAALILNANGIKTYLFDSLRPVPELSFAVRELKCIAGIMITASHNPPKYNGYKVYWEDGAQIVPPVDKDIITEVNNITDYGEIKKISQEEAENKKLYNLIGKEIDEKYMDTLQKLVLNPDIIKKQKDLKIVYTPLHGTGNIPVRRVLKELGFENVYVVPEQELPDGDFPTVSYPNPEAEEAFALGLALGRKVDADLILATDPDADRLGVYVKDSKTGEYHSLTGNMSGCLIGDYIIGQKKAINGSLPADGAFIKSIVSTNMADAIAEYYGIQLIEVLTGFKFIGGKILEFEKTGKGTYLFGMEESYGCLTGTYARDKDAVVASMALCEAAAYYKTKNMTLWDAMLAMYEKYGYYKDHVESITLKGIEGLAKIQEIMDTLRSETLTEIGGYKVEKVRDYKKDTITDLATGAVTATGLPSSNVLYYELNDAAWFCVRPSGTEPKVKFYIGVKGSSMEEAEQKYEVLGKAVLDKINKML